MSLIFAVHFGARYSSPFAPLHSARRFNITHTQINVRCDIQFHSHFFLQWLSHSAQVRSLCKWWTMKRSRDHRLHNYRRFMTFTTIAIAFTHSYTGINDHHSTAWKTDPLLPSFEFSTFHVKFSFKILNIVFFSIYSQKMPAIISVFESDAKLITWHRKPLWLSQTENHFSSLSTLFSLGLRKKNRKLQSGILLTIFVFVKRM